MVVALGFADRFYAFLLKARWQIRFRISEPCILSVEVVTLRVVRKMCGDIRQTRTIRIK